MSSLTSHPWTRQKIRRFRKALLDFFGERRRDLPWREASDPYRILVSEVMLQQTRVEAALPYYRRWMERFPDPDALARADLDEVLAVWQGLGYYARARNLHQAVREVVERYGGQVPEDPDRLRELPGVGPYTAGAVASIAFGRSVPAVDGNARRVLARLMDARTPTPKELEEWAMPLVDPERPGEFNQALMELGSLVCTPRDPGCGRCPVADHCASRAKGTQAERPAPKVRPEVPKLEEAVAVVFRWREEGAVGPSSVLLRRRPTEGLLGGMWELPGVEVDETTRPRDAAARLARELLRAGRVGREDGAAREDGAVALGEGLPLAPVDHSFSHRRMRYFPFRFDVGDEVADEPDPPVRWVGRGELDGHPLPAAQRRILAAAEGT